MRFYKAEFDLSDVRRIVDTTSNMHLSTIS